MSGQRDARVRRLLRPIQQQEDQARQEFARARAELHASQQRVQRMEQAMARHDERIRREIQAGGELNSLGFYRQCFAELREALGQAWRDRHQAQGSFQRRREEMLRLRTERKAMAQWARKLRLEQAQGRDRRATREQDQLHAAARTWRGEQIAEEEAHEEPLGLEA